MSDTSTPAFGAPSPVAESSVLATAAPTVADMATTAKDKAQAVAEQAADAIDQNRDMAARVLANAAFTIRDAAPRLPGGGNVTRWAEAAADGIDDTSHYVREHKARQMMADLTQLVRRHPGAAVVGAAVVGLIVGRGLRRDR